MPPVLRQRVRQREVLGHHRRDAVEQAAKELGGIDSLVYATGVGPLARMTDVRVAQVDLDVVSFAAATVPTRRVR